LATTAAIGRFASSTEHPRAALTPVSLAGPDERLIQGIWPRSLAVWMVAGYIALFIIRPWEMLMPALGAIRFERIYAVAMICAVLVDGFRLRLSSQVVTVLAFTAMMSICTANAWSLTAALPVYYTYLTLVVFFFVLLSVARTPYTLAFLVTCYLIAMGLYLSKAVWEYYVNDAHYFAMGVRRLIGIEYTFGGPNEVAGSIVLSMPMLLFVYSIRREFTASWPKFWRRWLTRCLAGYFFLAMWAMMLTNSRSGMVSFALFVGLVAMRGRGIATKVGYGLAALALIGVLWVVAPPQTKKRLETIWNPSAGPANAYESAMGRVNGLKLGILIFRRFPLLGVGPGNFIPYRIRHVDGGIWDPHNLLGQSLSEIGLLGTLAFAALVLVALGNAQRAIRLGPRCRDPRAVVPWRLALAARETLILLIFDGLFGHNLLRFTWLWAAGFALMALLQLRDMMRQERAAERLEVSTQLLLRVGA